MDPERNEAQRSEVEGCGPMGFEAQRSEVEGWHVYILLCRDGAFYVGMTSDLQRRWEEHSSGRGGHYTRCNPPVRMVHTEHFATRPQAESRERQLKGWTRRKKQALINGDLVRLKSV